MTLLAVDLGTSPHRRFPARGTLPRPGASVKARLFPGPDAPILSGDAPGYDERRAALVRTSPEAYFRELRAWLDERLAAAGVPRADVRDVVLGFPARVVDGFAAVVNNLHDEAGPWRNVHVLERWAEAWGPVPGRVRVVNDMVLGAAGLLARPPAFLRDAAGPVRYVVTGGGFGAIGIRRAPGGHALEPFEHGGLTFEARVRVTDAPVEVAHLENDAASARAVLDNYARLAREDPAALEPRDVVARAGTDDAARRALERYAEGLGVYAGEAASAGCRDLVLGGPFAPAVDVAFRRMGSSLEARIRHHAPAGAAPRVHLHEVPDNTLGGPGVLRLEPDGDGFLLPDAGATAPARLA